MNALKNRIYALKNIHRPKPNHFDTLGPQQCIAFLIAHLPFRPFVPLTINLNSKPRFMAVEIDNVPPDWILPSKAEADRASAQPRPQYALRLAHRGPQASSAVARHTTSISNGTRHRMIVACMRR